MIPAKEVTYENVKQLARKALQTKARAHADSCYRCMVTVIMYAGEIRQALAGDPLPDELASRIRARLCKEGAAILDQILGVDP